MIGTGFSHYGRAAISCKNTNQNQKTQITDSTETAIRNESGVANLTYYIEPIIQKICSYLGEIKAVDNHESPSLEKLKTEAYILTLPTGKQLKIINSVIERDDTCLPVHNDPVLTEVANLLDEYNALVNKYNATEETSKRDRSITGKTLKTKLAAIDKKLQNAVSKPGSGKSGAYQALRNGLRDAETLRGLRTDWRYWEMLGISPAEYDYVAENPDTIDDWLDCKFSAKEALSFKAAGYHPREVVHFKNTGITGPMAKQLIQRGYTKEFFEETLGVPANLAQAGFFLQDHHDAWAENDGQHFGEGAINTVTIQCFKDEALSSEYRERNPATKMAEGIFKPEKFATPDSQNVQLQAGESNAKVDGAFALFVFEIHNMVKAETLTAPRIAGRNLASYRLATAFGADVIAPCELAISNVPITTTQRSDYKKETGQDAPERIVMPGIMMPKVEQTYGLLKRKKKSKSPNKKEELFIRLPKSSKLRAKVLQNLTWLQLLDHVSGQVDRHFGNILISSEGKVKGIDNDQCWPELVLDSNLLAIDVRNLESGLRGTYFPDYVDHEMVASICGFSDSELKKWRAKNLSNEDIQTAKERAKGKLVQSASGYITKAELEAAEQRLAALQDHLLGDKVKIVDSWSTKEKKMRGTKIKEIQKNQNREVITSYYGYYFLGGFSREFA